MCIVKSDHVARITELQKLRLKEGFLHKIFLDDLLSYGHKLYSITYINPLNAKLNPNYHLLTLLGAHVLLSVSRLMVNVGFEVHAVTKINSVLLT